MDGIESFYGESFLRKTVRVEINRNEGWVNFYVDEKNQGKIYGLPLADEDIYFALRL